MPTNLSSPQRISSFFKAQFTTGANVPLLTRLHRAMSAKSLVRETSILHPLRLQVHFHAGTVWNDNEGFDIDLLRLDAGFEFDYMEILRAGIVWPVGPLRTGSPRAYIGWGVHVL